MRFKLDENIPVEVLWDLSAAGHDADSVHDEDLDGEPDPVVLDHARIEERTFLTLDKGIGDLREHNPSHYHGIVLFRPPATGRATTLEFIRKHLPHVLTLDLIGRLIVVTESGVRTR